MRLFIISALLLATSLAQTGDGVTGGNGGYAPQPYIPPPQTQPEGVPPPLIKTAEDEGYHEHKAHTEALNQKVVELQKEDADAAQELVDDIKGLLGKAKDKVKIANKRNQKEEEKVENDNRNHAAASIFMKSRIEKVKASEADAKNKLKIVEKEADSKVDAAMKDVSAKNQVISTKNREIEKLNTDLQAESAKVQKECDAQLGAKDRDCREQLSSLKELKNKEIVNAKKDVQTAQANLESEKSRCKASAASAKSAHDSEVAQIKDQVKQLNGDIKNKQKAIEDADSECVAKLQTEKDTCSNEKAQVKKQAQVSCKMEVDAANAKAKQCEQRVTNEKNKYSQYESKKTKEIEDLKAAASREKEAVVVSYKKEIQQIKRQHENDRKQAIAKEKKDHKVLTDHLRAQITKIGTKYNAALQQSRDNCNGEKDQLRGELQKAEKARDKLKDQYQELVLKFKQFQDSYTQQMANTNKLAKISDNNAVDLASDAGETQLSSSAATYIPTNVTVASPAMIVYCSLILSSLFLSGLVYKLRNESMKHKNYNSVLTNRA